MKKIFVLIFVNLFILQINKSFADGGIYDAYFIYQLNRSVNSYMKAVDFDGSVFDNPASLILKGGQNKTWKNGSTDITGGGLQYRIFKCDESAPSFSYSGGFSWVSDDGGGNQTWEKSDDNVDLISSLTPGIYTLEIYFEAYSNEGNKYYTNGGSNFKATIIKYNKSISSGYWNNSATWSAGIPTSYQPILIQTGYTVSLDVNSQAALFRNEGTFNCSNYSMTLQNSCSTYGTSTFTNSGTFTGGTGKIIFNDNSTISGTTTFHNVDISGGVNFGTNSTIDDTLTILSGGYVNTNAPTYSSNSTLTYNTGASYNRYTEWYENTSTGAGYPNKILITGSTTLNTNSAVELYARGLQIDNGSTFTILNTSTKSVIISGNVLINGNFVFSDTIGGDLKLTGDLTKGTSGIIDWGDGIPTTDKGRAIFFIGTGNQNIIGINKIPYILILNSAHVLLYNDLSIDGDGVNFISIFGNGILDLNGKELTCLASGRIEVDGTTGNTEKLITGTTNSRLVFTGTSNGTVYQVSSGTLKIDKDVTVGVESGTLDFGSNITDLYGTLEIRGQASIASSHYPVYHSGSTLKYVNIADVTTSAEWTNTNGPSNLWIACTSGKKVILNENKTISNIGSLIIQSGKLDLNSHTLTYNANSKLEYRLNKNTNYFVDDTSGFEWQQTSPIPYNVDVTSGNVYINGNRSITNNLTIKDSATLYVTAVKGQLTVTDSLIVKTDANITLLCQNNDSVAGSLITNGTVTNNGTMIAQRYVSGFRYTFLTAPNSVTNSSIFMNNPNGYTNNNIYYYNESFQAPTTPDNELYSEWKDPANQFDSAWVAFLNQTLSAGKGYAYYNDLNLKFEFNGTFNTGDKVITLSAHYNDGNSGYFDGWNLIANPYPSALDWQNAAWTKTAVYDVIYFWDGTSSNDGNYKYYAATGDYTDGSDVVNGATQFIPAMQAFFVKVKTGYDGSSLTIPNSARVHSNQIFWTKNNQLEKKSQFIKLQTTANGVTDELVVRFIPEAALDFDDYDASKLYSSSITIPQIYSFNQPLGQGYAINSLPMNKINDSIHLGYEIQKRGISNSNFKLINKNIDNRFVILYDKLVDTAQNLTFNDFYNFTIADSSDVRNRFIIMLDTNKAPYLTENISDYTINFGDTVNYQIAQDIFKDYNFGDTLTFSLLNVNIPTWLNFDDKTLTFSGQSNAAAEIPIILKVTDYFGASVSDTFLITIKPVLPTVQTNYISNVTQNSVNAYAQVISNGGENIDTVGFCWSENINPTIDNNFMYTTLSINDFNATITNLQPSTTYYLRAFAKNSAGVNYSNNFTFTTNTLNTNELADHTYKIYPNPVSDFLIIQTTESDNNQKVVEIYNISGKIIQTIYMNSNNLVLTLQEYKSGSYIIKITSDKKTENFLIIKN